MYILSYLDIFFCKHFYYKTGFYTPPHQYPSGYRVKVTFGLIFVKLKFLAVVSEVSFFMGKPVYNVISLFVCQFVYLIITLKPRFASNSFLKSFKSRLWIYIPGKTGFPRYSICIQQNWIYPYNPFSVILLLTLGDHITVGQMGQVSYVGEH